VELRLAPLVLPQAPLTISDAPQESVVPVFAPWQVQVHGPVPLTADGVPELHKPVPGADKKSPLFDDPQAPLIIGTKVAVTFLALVIVNVQLLPLPLSQPLQLPKIEPADGVAVSVTEVLSAYTTAPVLPLQVIVPVSGVTVPPPAPASVTVKDALLLKGSGFCNVPSARAILIPLCALTPSIVTAWGYTPLGSVHDGEFMFWVLIAAT